MKNISQLQKIYNTEIRKDCKYFKNKIDMCLEDNFNDIFPCEYIFIEFTSCINHFNNKFKNKYFKNKNFEIIY